MAGLALVAAAMLIANTVGLAMVQRAREIAVMKAVGFSQRRVLGVIVLEHALVGLIGGAAGLTGAWAAMAAINRLQHEAQLQLNPLAAAGILAMAVGVAAWRLGAGRARKEDPVSPTAGVVWRATVGDEVVAGEPLLELHLDDPSRLPSALEALEGAIEVSPTPVPAPTLVLDRVG